MTELTINMALPKEKHLLLEMIRGLHLKTYRITIAEHRPRRSDRQNRWYFPCFCQPLADFLTAQGEPTTKLEAHLILKKQFLRGTRVVPKTGELVEYVKESSKLSTVEFNTYLDDCANWLADMFDIRVPEPSIYHEREAA